MYRTIAILLLTIGLLVPAASAAERPSRWRGVWRVSQALLCGANAADIASSWGKTEANPLLRTGSRFSYGSMAIKLGALTGSLAAQHYLIRKNPAHAPLFASANLAATAALAIVAEHNMHIPKPN